MFRVRHPLRRRGFLKLGAAIAAAAGLRSSPAFPALCIASTLPLPFPHLTFPNPEALLSRDLAGFDLLLVPAYAAVALIRRQALRLLPGPPGRAHDPDGAFTIPYTSVVAALLYTGAPPRAWDDLWARPSLWPDSPRLVIGAALLRRSYSPNDTHPSHLGEAEMDLMQLRPHIVPGPAAGLRAGLASLALAVTPAQPEIGVFLPPDGAPLLEYDWVIPLGAPNPEAALAFIARPEGHIRPLASPTRLIPLTPLPAAAREQRAEIWARVRRASRSFA